jgi:hypothetical protein
MTRAEAVRTFKRDILPGIPSRDKPAIREAWGIFTDALCKDGRITLEQYETWEGVAP